MGLLLNDGLYGSALQVASGRNTNPMSQIAGIQALWDLDTTLSSSYPGSGNTLSNIITSPYDGETQTAYDFSAGSTPTFVGSANDPAAYINCWANPFIIGANTNSVKNFHKTTGGQPFTLVMACKTPPSYNGTAGYWGNTTTASAEGVLMRITSGSLNQMDQRAGSVNGLSTPFSSTPSTANNHLMAFAVDYTGGTLKTALDARTFTSKTLVSHSTTGDPSFRMSIMSSGQTSDWALNNTFLYNCCCFAKILSDTELGQVIDVLNSRHNRTYA